VKNDGSPVTVFSSAVRNLLRIVDFLPRATRWGWSPMLVDKKHRRLGDLLAGTVLVRDEQIDLSRYEQVTTTMAVNQWELATSYLSRFDQFEPAAAGAAGDEAGREAGAHPSPTASAIELRDAIAAHLKGP